MQTNNEGQEDIQFSWGGKIKWVKNWMTVNNLITE
jgi:hypothetical protein